MKEEQYIQDLFQTIRELPPEVELSAIEQFVLAQPAAAFQPPAGGGSSLLTIKNSIIMISSISIIGSAVIFFSGGNIKPASSGPSNKPVHQQTVVPDSSVLTEENIPDAVNPIIKKDVAVLPISNTEDQNSVQNNVAENSSVPMLKQTTLAETLIACDDKEHITSRFVESLVKDGMIDPKSFSLKITHTSLIINNKKQSDQTFEKYKELFEKLSGRVLNSGTSLSASVFGKDCSCAANLSINDKKDEQNSSTGASTGTMNKMNEEEQLIGLGVNTGNLTTQSAYINSDVTRNVAPFSSIVLLNGGSLHVEEGDAYSVSLLAGSEADFEKVNTEVRNNVLFVDKQGKTKGKKWLILKVTIPANKLVGLNITGSGGIDVDSPFNGLNQIVVGGSGYIDINKPFDVGDLQAAVTGSGSIRIVDMKAKNIIVSIPGSGSIEMTGTADNVKASINGSGVADLRKLQTQSSVCAIAGSGEVDVKVERELSVLISGSGTVNYWGTPKVTQSVTGSGSAQSRQ